MKSNERVGLDDWAALFACRSSGAAWGLQLGSLRRVALRAAVLAALALGASAVVSCGSREVEEVASISQALCGDGICEPDEDVGSCFPDCGIIIEPEQSWVTIGPAPIETTIVYGAGGPTAEGAAGRGTVIAVNPENHAEVWFGTANGGLWHTTNIRADDPDWTPLTDELDSLAIGAVALEDCDTTITPPNPGACDRVWVGTGENVLRRHSYAGAGLYLGRVVTSMDVGVSSYVFSPVGGSGSSFRNGSIFNVIPEDSSVYATLSLGMTANKNHSTVWAPEPTAGYGIHRCDGSAPGCTWTRILASPSPHASGDLTGLPTDLERDPQNAGQYLAGIMGQGLYRSLAGDDTTWCPLNPGAPQFGSGVCPGVAAGLPTAGSFDFVELGVAPGSQNMVVAMSNCPQQNATSSADGDRGGLTADECPIQLYRSADGGASWAAVPAGSGDFTTYSRYTHALTVLPGGAFCYGGLRLWCMNATDPAPFEIGANSLHPDHHDVKMFPGLATDGVGTVFYSSNDGGMYVSQDGSAVFKGANENLVTAQFHGIGVDEVNEDPGNPFGRVRGVCGGLQDHGVVTFKGTRVWPHDTGFGDGGECLQLDPSVRWASDWSSVQKNLDAVSGIFAAYPDRTFEPTLVEHVATQNIYYATDTLSVVPPTPASMTPAPVQISPVFDSGTYDFPAIERSTNVITAIGVAPSDQNRVYAGLYDGQVWASTPGANVVGGSCLTVPDCWQQADAGLPDGMLSSIAVHPSNPDEAWAVFSSFGAQNVWRTTNGGDSWSPMGNGVPANLPVNVIKYDPRDATFATLLLGADRGVYQTSNSGANWGVLAPGLPNAPIFDLVVEAEFQRVYAGTHGRGVFMFVNAPEVITFEGWTEDGIWDIPIYGNGFACGAEECSCTVEVLRQNGEVCAGPSALDARGANIRVRDGMLGSDIPFVFDNHPVILACFNGDCVGGATIESCNQPGNLIAAVRLSCVDNDPIVSPVAEECPQLAQPPAGALIVSPDQPPPLPPPGSAAAGGELLLPLASQALQLQSAAEVNVIPVLMSSPDNGGDRQMCAAQANLEAGDTVELIQEKLFQAIAAEPDCVQAGVSARFLGQVDMVEGEDVTDDFRVSVNAPNAFGAQIVMGYNVGPGDAEGLCLRGSELGVTTTNQLGILQLGFVVPSEGASGGTLELLESSSLGSCRLTVELAAGDSAEDIAEKVAAAFQAPGVPGPESCRANSNPRDIVTDGGSVVTIMSRDFEVCVRDANVGLTFGPHGVDMSTLDAELDELAVYGTSGIELRDGVEVFDQMSGFAAVAANDVLGATYFPDADSGDVFSVGSVELKDRAHVHGDVETGGVLLRGNNTVVDGDILENTTVRLPSIEGFLVDFPQPPGPNHNIDPGGQLTLPPGNYGQVTIKPGARLDLDGSGAYYFTSLILDQGMIVLHEGSGPIELYVQGTLIHRGSITTLSGAHPAGFLAYQGTAPVFIESRFRGTLVAPRARIVLRSVAGGHFGSFWGEFVEVDAHADVHFVAYEGEVPESP